jgi:hypothetical protein
MILKKIAAPAGAALGHVRDPRMVVEASASQRSQPLDWVLLAQRRPLIDPGPAAMDPGPAGVTAALIREARREIAAEAEAAVS